MRTYEYIIIHCSASNFGSENEIRKWHTDKGWRNTGYHFIINNGQVKSDIFYDFMDGTVELGRPINEVGAHCKGGYNSNSIGICLIGHGEYTQSQYDTMYDVIIDIMEKYDIPIENVLGHYETPQSGGKTCPEFDVKTLRSDLTAMTNDYPPEFK